LDSFWLEKPLNGGTSNVARRLACGMALAVGSLIGLIDSVASLALAILTAPAELAGIKLNRAFITRILLSTEMSALSLTVLMYLNISKGSIYLWSVGIDQKGWN
jgi:hypothetical protein